ncbi:WD40 repeat-containing protein [Tieghemostelium lacteum]|uniref:WD40 repeat-containing protein n=1 Tax=Tieghemostelium lacteum TaxID=361077 RepID=A0A151ZAP5_TIELA|nr:WD40 repeat-containing protein [Tieghemostelium lacteum]|eukprot:KYQ91006.1 WD40 repeat-containing protein [Tieghemostelium lacteum]
MQRGRGISTARGAARGGARGGATRGGATRGGATRGGSTRGGSTRGGATRGGSAPRATERKERNSQSFKPSNENKQYDQPVYSGIKQSTFFQELKTKPIPYLGTKELRDLKLKLINIVSASLIKEPRVNQLTPTLETIMTSVYHISYYDPEFILKLALYTRDELGIRTVANYLICLAAVIPLCQPYLKKYFKDLVKLPSDWLELPNIISKLTESKTIPKSLRNVMVNKFVDFDTYQLGKYNTEGKMKRKRKQLKFMMKKNPEEAEKLKKQSQENQTSSFKQLIRVLHLSTPVVNIMSLLGKKYPATYEEFLKSKLPGEFEPDRAGKRMKLPIPETWETLVSEKGNKASTWEELMDHNKLPFTAMLRNLRNMMICGIQPSYHKWILNKLTSEQSIANSRQFPLRFLAAFDSIPKDIVQLKEWAEEKKIKISYYPAQDLFKTYREALDTAVKLSTVLNVSPIRGSTVVFCYVDPKNLRDPSETAPTRGKQPTSKYSAVENAILLSLMCKYVCEDCQLYFVGYNRNSELVYHAVPVLAFDSILENMARLIQDVKSKFDFPHDSGISQPTPEFPTNVILNDYLLPGKRMDNLLVLNDSVLEIDNSSINKNILTKYRQDINPDLLYVSIDLSGKSSNIPKDNQHENDVYISGFSDSILKFIAERGGSDQQLQYVEQIDQIKKIKNPAKNLASAPTGTEETQVPLVVEDSTTSQTNTQSQRAKIEKPWKHARVFLSSTFLDMHGERDLLVKYVFPELRERCQKRRIHLTEVDLRWGITEEESSKNKSVELCLEEVDRCRPFFIGLLGQRYGWVPTKDKIPLDAKYDWIRELPGKYNRSITELEMRYATMNSAQSSDNCVFYMRDPSFMKEVPREYRSQFDSEDANASVKLDSLKQFVQQTGKYSTYKAKWGGAIDGTPYAAGLEDLHQQLLNDLWERICRVFPLDQDEIHDQNDLIKMELNQHQLYADMKCKGFVGRKDEISCLYKFLEIPRSFSSSKASKMIFNKTNTLVLSGKPGSGKTSLISYFLNQSIHEPVKGLQKQQVPIVIQHFIGSIPSSNDIRKMLLSLCLQLNQKVKLNETIDVDSDYSQLKIMFPQILKKASLKAQKIIVAIDGLDQLDKMNSAHSLDWLPQQVGGQVKLILSVVDGDHTLSVLERRKTPPTQLTISPLDQTDRKSLIRNKFNEFSKKLDESSDNNQMLMLLSKTDAFNPLYLVLACEELRYFGSFENLSDKIRNLQSTLPKLFDDILDRLEKDHGKEMIGQILGAIAATRQPLYEDDILIMLARKDERSLPTSIWSRIYRSIQPLLLTSLDQNEKGLEFFHNQLKLVVLKRYHSISESSTRIHKMIASFYQKIADPDSNQSWKGKDSVAFSELPYHLTKSKQYIALEQILTNLLFIQKKCEFGLSFEILNDYLEVLGDSDDEEKTSSFSTQNKMIKNKDSLEKLKDFYRFVSGNTHILSRSPELTFQQAFNQPNSSQVHLVAQKSMSSHRESWVEWLNKPEMRDSCKQTITGLAHGATCVAYSLDSKFIASAGKDSIIRIYKASNGAEIQTLVGHSNWVSSLSFSSDSKTLASASWDETVIVWDLVVGKDIATFRNHKRAVNCVEFSPVDNNLLLTASWDSTIMIFNIADRAIFRLLKAHSKPVNCATWSRDGTKIASCSWDGTIKLWDPFETIAANRLLLVIDESTNHGSMKSCKFSQNSKQIIATTMKNSVLLFDTTSAKLLSVIGTHSKSVNHCSFSDDGQQFVTSSDDNTLKLWASQLGNQLSEYRVTFEGWVNCLAFSPTSSVLAMGCSDCVVRVYDVSGQIYKEIAKFTGHTRAISSLSFNRNGKLLASTSEDKSIRVWDLTTNTLSYHIENAHNETINCVSFAPFEDNLLISCSDDYHTKIWSGKTLVETLAGNNNTVKSCMFSPDGKYVATVSRDNCVTLWLVGKPYKQLAKLQGHTDWVNFCAFSPDSKKIVSGGWDFNVRVWSVANKKELLLVKGHAGSVEKGFFSADKKYIITCAFDGTVKVWDSEFGTEVTSLKHDSRISDVVSSLDGSGRIFSTSDDGVVKSWLPVEGKCVATFTGHSGAVKQSVFSAGSGSSSSSFGNSSSSTFNKSIVSSSEDGTVKIWDFNKQTQSTSVHQGQINDCSFSADGKILATVGQDQYLRIWDTKKNVNIKSFVLDSPGTSCAFSPKGSLLVGRLDGKFLAYDSNTNFTPITNCPAKISNANEKVTSITALPSKEVDIFVVSGWGNRAYLLNLTANSLSDITRCEDWMECTAISPNGELIAIGGRGNSLLLIQPGSTVHSIAYASSDISSICFSPDSKNLAIGSFQGDVHIYNIQDRTITKIEISQTAQISQLAYLDHNRIVSASKDRSLIVWNSSTQTIENEFIQNSPITSLSIHLNSIATVDTNGNLSFLNYHKMK